MAVKLAFLGTGTCNATPRNPPALALSNGREVVLIDCGGGCYHQLSRLKDDHFKYHNISTILLTHFHVDHVSGLVDIIWGEMWDSRGPRSEPITIVGPPGLIDFIDIRVLPFIGDYSIPYKIHPIEIDEGALYKGSFFTAQSYTVSHTVVTYGYLINTGSRKLAITGDTGFCDNLATLLSGSDIAVMEWSKSDHSENDSHISNRGIEQLIKRGVLPSNIYVTHMYLPHGVSFDEQVLFNKSFLKEYSKQFFFPHDLDTITIE